mgnify:CR=1 FL=1
MILFAFLLLTDLFQSTPLREGRHYWMFNRKSKPRFNPRPSVRGDQKLTPGMADGAEFQSTPLREGRRLIAHLLE